MNITLAPRKFSHNMHSQDCIANYIDIDAGLVPVPCTPTMNKTLSRITHNGLFALCSNVIKNEHEEDIVSWRSEQLKRGATICKVYLCHNVQQTPCKKTCMYFLWFTDPCLMIYRLISRNHLYHQRMEISPYIKSVSWHLSRRNKKTYCICQFSNIER